MAHRLRCRCDTLQGHIRLPAMTNRAVCYCKDCQAYAHHLGRATDVLDRAGGTGIVALHPRQVQFERGLEGLACVSLSQQGLLRWYASCCRTPIGNTPRNPHLAYVGLVDTCLADPAHSLDSAFGPVRMRLNTGSARAPVESSAWTRNTTTMLRLGASMLTARLSGNWRENPFFDLDGGPVRTPHVLAAAEREGLRAQG